MAAEAWGDVPAWVTKPRAVVVSVEDFLCWMTAETLSPFATTAWSALRWVGQFAGEVAPGTQVACEPTSRRAMAELDVCAELTKRSAPYPAPEWFADRGLGSGDLPPRGRWEYYSGWGWGRDAAAGGLSGLGWLFGGMDDIGGLVPRYYEDGTRIPVVERREWRRVLADLEIAPQPRPGSSRPLSPDSVRDARRACDGGPIITPETAGWAPRH